MLDVRMGGRDAPSHLGQEADAIERSHLNLRLELGLHATRPVYGDPLRRLLAVLGEVPASVAMDDDAAAARHETDDLVTGNRITAVRVADDGAFRARDLEGLAWVGCVRAALVAFLGQETRNHGRQAFAQANLLEQSILVGDADLL
jgi:hypothetical protein